MPAIISIMSKQVEVMLIATGMLFGRRVILKVIALELYTVSCIKKQLVALSKRYAESIAVVEETAPFPALNVY